MTLVIDIPESAQRLVPDAAVDFERMRRYRIERARQAMADSDLDVLMLGTGANIQYVSGARRLWHAGNMPFGPSAVLVRDTGNIYMISYTTDGIPDDIPLPQLCPISWNPQNLLGFLGSIREVREARRIGVDGMTPFFAKSLAEIAPQAAFVSAEPAMRRARSIKSDDEIACLGMATAIAEASVASARDFVQPGVAPRALRSIAMEKMTEFGATIPGYDGLFAALPKDPDHRLSRLISDQPLMAGDHGGLSVSATFAGYEGISGRTSVCGEDKGSELVPLRAIWEENWSALRGLLRPGAPLAEIHAHLSAAHSRSASFCKIAGTGIGMEPPLLSSTGRAATGPSDVLAAGMALTVESYRCDLGLGAYYRYDTVLITSEGCEILSRSP